MCSGSQVRRLAWAYHVKQNKLKKLQKRALNRNPDEFAFHMINSEMKDGFHFEKEKPEHTEAQLKIMQSQDLNYVNYKLSTEIKKIEKLKSSLAILDIDERPKNVHTFYVDSKSEAKRFDVAKQLQTHPSLLDRPYNRPTLEALKRLKLKEGLDEESFKKAADHINQQYNELCKRLERAKELLIISQKLEMKKKLVGKNEPPSKLVKEATKTSAPIYVWKKERKR
ncbi:probable U3 small nucleolar RNA-associated protein 11 [Uloborus diversus]|uniref:probable U3 small nucleolar RNA-associated protein 11 n=1 Tax=Uloborus diversus TaxID=327109 RepID=UPI0024094B1C|nr:probable U3 small nucleolar RNA-associated protein 11 [Uloborus diversus]